MALQAKSEQAEVAVEKMLLVEMQAEALAVMVVLELQLILLGVALLLLDKM
jgi:hypothetical protein